jgi:thymidylate synthase (FAD)
MRIIEQNIVFEEEIDGPRIIRRIENAAKTCYKAEHTVGNIDDAKAFVRSLIKRGHESTIEHISISARVITNRSVSHEWVRHRVGCSYSQESTRYCNYGAEKFGNEITVIWPWYLGEPLRHLWTGDTEPHFPVMHNTMAAYTWYRHMQACERAYLELLEQKCKPEEARGVLPNDLKTEFVTTMTLRAWRHFFKLRCAKTAHPQIRELALKALSELHSKIPVIFDDLYEIFLKE